MQLSPLAIALLVVAGLAAGCKKDAAPAAPAPPVPREMRLKINGQQSVWPCRAGLTNILHDFIIIEGGDVRGQEGISITYEEQPSHLSPKPFKPVRATVVLNGVARTITGIGTSTSHINYLLGTYSENSAANKMEGAFSGEENQLGLRLESGEFTTVIH